MSTSFSVIVSDLFQCEVDAIVIPVPPKKRLEGKLGGTLFEQCGDQLKTKIKSNPPLKMGECEIHNVVGKPYKKVILVCNPKNDGSPRYKLIYNLAACVKNVLSLAKANGVKSIAIPRLSGGAYGYLPAQSIKGILDGALQYGKNEAEQMNIFFVLDSPKYYFNHSRLYETYHLNLISIDNVVVGRGLNERPFTWYTKGAFSKYSSSGPKHEIKSLIDLLEYERFFNQMSREELCDGIMTISNYNKMLADPSKKILKKKIILFGLKLSNNLWMTEEMLKYQGMYLDEDQDAILFDYYDGSATLEDCENYYKK